jgi:hypothetical protein
MRGNKDRNSTMSGRINQVPELTARQGINTPGGLVEKNNGRIVENGY